MRKIQTLLAGAAITAACALGACSDATQFVQPGAQPNLNGGAIGSGNREGVDSTKPAAMAPADSVVAP